MTPIWGRVGNDKPPALTHCLFTAVLSAHRVQLKSALVRVLGAADSRLALGMQEIS